MERWAWLAWPLQYTDLDLYQSGWWFSFARWAALNKCLAHALRTAQSSLGNVFQKIVQSCGDVWRPWQQIWVNPEWRREMNWVFLCVSASFPLTDLITVNSCSSSKLPCFLHSTTATPNSHSDLASRPLIESMSPHRRPSSRFWCVQRQGFSVSNRFKGCPVSPSPKNVSSFIYWKMVKIEHENHQTAA